MSAQVVSLPNPRRGMDRAAADPLQSERAERVTLYQQRLDALLRRTGRRRISDNPWHAADLHGGVTVFAEDAPHTWRSVREIVLDHLEAHGSAVLDDLLALVRSRRPEVAWTRVQLRMLLFGLARTGAIRRIGYTRFEPSARGAG